MFDSLSREMLYEKVWSQPLAKVAAELSCSKETLAARCRRERIPTPSTGYWRKIEFGHSPKRPPLPPAGDLPEIKPLPEILASPRARDLAQLDPRAQAVQELLAHAKVNSDGIVSVDTPQYPRVHVSKAKIEAAVWLVHGILVLVERTGVPFRKARNKYETGYFENDLGRLYLKIEEPTEYVKGSPAWQPPKRAPSRQLTVTLEAQREYRSWSKSWIEGKDGAVKDLPEKVAEGITERYRELAKQAAEAEEKRKRDHEERLRKEEVRKKEEHEKALEMARLGRAQDLFRAAEWTRLFEQTLTFVAQCEQRWMAEGPATAEQTAWLAWARQTAEAWSPVGYPDPAKDGAFDPAAVPFGGPYPSTRNYPRPPTMPELVVEQQSSSSWSYGQTKKEPYPFWLRHPRR